MSKRLLIVDDEPNLLIAVAACLRTAGYEVLTARSGAEALRHVAGSIPDLIVSDIRMPVMDGYQLARNLRNSPRLSLVPIIFLTAKDETTDRIEGFRVGVDAYIMKPFDPNELLAVVSNILARIERTHKEIARLYGAEQAKDEAPAFADEDLTETEERIAQTVARGLSNKEIAAEFGISVRTVESHISHILGKKQFSSRAEIVRHVIERAK